jgi:tRNA (cytidine32/guanosine34-2'-O)-methyltransferase
MLDNNKYPQNIIEEGEEEENTLEKPGKKLSAYRNISYSKRDIFYRKAKEEGFRARSVYKLKEIHYNYNILSPSYSNFVDLCAAPGSWTQMLRILTKSNPNAKIVSVDIQHIVPIEGVTIIKGDITRQDTIEKILSNFDNKKVDVIIFDGAPDVTGVIDVDMYMQVELIIFALVIVMKLLKKGGIFVAKMFKVGAGDDLEKVKRENLYAVKSDFYYEKVKILFDNVFYFKPTSSRASSHETYLICENFEIEDDEILKVIEKATMEEIFNYEELIKDEKTKNFLQFLVKGKYSL